jgi:hypothetical protein
LSLALFPLPTRPCKALKSDYNYSEFNANQHPSTCKKTMNGYDEKAEIIDFNLAGAYNPSLCEMELIFNNSRTRLK